MKRSRDSESVRTCCDETKPTSKSSSRPSSSSLKEGNASSSSCRSSSDNKTYHNHSDHHREEHRRESSDHCSGGSRSHGSSRSGPSGIPSSRGDSRNSYRKDSSSHEKDRHRSRSHSPERHRLSRRHSGGRSRERRPSRDNESGKKVPERRRSRSRGSSRDKYSSSKEKRRRRSRSLSSSPRHGSSDIVVTGPDLKKVSVHIPEPVKKSNVLGKEVFSTLPLNDSLSKIPTGRLTTPQMAIQQAMAAMSAKAQEMTGISLPKYYNPAAVNPLKYAEQMQKRKMLWQNKNKVETPVAPNTNWDGALFSQDQDGKMASKFKRLMGMKDDASAAAAAPTSEANLLKKQEELFRSLDQQYEQARVSTHTQRGVGLGYSSSAAAAAQFNVFPK